MLINFLLVHSEVTDKEGLLLLIRKYLSFDFKEKFIKIGMTASNINEAMNLAEEIYVNFKVKVGLVDEENTNNVYVDAKNKNLGKDENAAYNITIKDPIMIYSV